MIDTFDFYDKMERSNIMLSFKGEITSDLLTSILKIIESKLESQGERPVVRRRVYNILVECLQNLYHHIDDFPMHTETEDDEDDSISTRTAIFMIGKVDDHYSIITANYMLGQHVDRLRGRLDEINSLDRQQLKMKYQEVLNDGQVRENTGGAGLGMIDIARKSGNKLGYEFKPVTEKYSFFTLYIKIV